MQAISIFIASLIGIAVGSVGAGTLAVVTRKKKMPVWVLLLVGIASGITVGFCFYPWVFAIVVVKNTPGFGMP